MQLPGVIGYPPISDNFRIGKLPPIQRTMERRLCVGRIWIFLVLGTILIVLGLVSVGIYFNIDGITSSTKYTEILPLYINSASIITAGVSVCLLFWRRLKVLVFLSVVICVANGFLCGLTGILTSTHVLKPLQYFTLCRHYVSQQLCQCFSPYRRDTLSLEFSDTEETKYDFEDASSCSSIENVLPNLLYTLVAVYSVVFLISLGSAIVALLVLRTERIKRGFYRDGAYEEVYTVSGSSSQDQSDSEAEVIPEVILNPLGDLPIVAKNSLSRSSISQLENPSINGTLRGRSITPQSTKVFPIQETPTISRAKTLDDFGKESLASRYRITKTPDHEIDTTPRRRTSKTPERDLLINVRQRLSKTPDREVGTRRRESFSGTKRLSRSCDSLDSSGRGSNDRLQGFNTNPSDGKKKGKLKEHRRKGKRAATVHTLDTDQLLLILNLQMRYLQETKEQQLNSQRRAVTPQPTSQKPVIPQRVRSHTPQPYKGKNQNAQVAQASVHTWSAYNNSSTPVGRTSKLRSGSDSSSRSGERYIEGSGAGDITNDSVTNDSANDSDSFCGTVERKPVFIPKNSGKNTAPQIRNGYNPYMQAGTRYSHSADKMHYVTYSDSMLNNQPKPKSRASVQNYFLPPEPLHRGSHQQLPPQPISRQRKGDQPLPPQPIHRGSSAFHIVDRSSKSRSPSVASDRVADLNELKTGRKVSKDFGDEAIRQNFHLTSRQFILTGTMENGNQYHQGNFQNGQQSLAGTQPQPGYPSDDLPPYSGPPSYKEYVSSCDNSVTSSLSSNPEEIYSFPKRRIRKDQKVMGFKDNGQGSSNSKPDSRDRNYNIQDYENENIYGNSPAMQSRRERNMQHSGSQRSRSQGPEAIYSSPSRSRVKQCIVPEDYYAALHKSIRPTDPGFRRFSHDQGPRSSSVDRVGNNQSEYTNVNDIQCGTYAFSPRNHHQIAPDAKYHEYEDVYDTVDPVPITDTPTSREPQSYSLNTHGFSAGVPKTKSKPKSPRKQRAPYPVSNVNARMPNYNNPDTNAVNCQVSQSVQNVHAENLQNIPRIKLNDVDTDECIDDDDVFIDGHAGCGTSGSQNIYSSKNTQGKVGSNVEVNGVHGNNADNLINEISDNSSSSSDQETETGYMKMSLPHKHAPVCQVPPTANGIACRSHMTTDLTNGEVDIDHMTKDGCRPMPDGIEGDEEPGIVRDQADYEETGV